MVLNIVGFKQDCISSSADALKPELPYATPSILPIIAHNPSCMGLGILWTHEFYQTISPDLSSKESVISEHKSLIRFVSACCCAIALMGVLQNTFADESTLIQVMAWYHQATSHYLNHCWPRSLTPHSFNKPQRVAPWSNLIQFDKSWPGGAFQKGLQALKSKRS